MDLKIISEIFKRFEKLQPHPTTELHYKNNFELLIAVVLSAQATDTMVNKITDKLFKIANTPEQIVKLGEKKLQEQIKSIGLFRVKATNIIKISKILIEQFSSQIPTTRKDLENLPGVGRKTANVILHTLFQQPVIAVDRHIFRVSNRIGLVKASTPLATELQLLKIIPKKFVINAHHWLILHGRYTCIARKPKCSDCVLKDLCEFIYIAKN
jgi:endonuclease-3